MRLKQKAPTRFQTRISIEREVISIINTEINISLSLFGMTYAAIEQWKKKAERLLPKQKADTIANLLLEIGKRCELLSDNSRDVFCVDELIPHDSYIEIIRLLKQAIEAN